MRAYERTKKTRGNVCTTQNGKKNEGEIRMTDKSLSLWDIPLGVQKNGNNSRKHMLHEMKEHGITKKELKMGMKVEREHTSDPMQAKKIAMDHLEEHPKYYTKLKKIFKNH